MNGKLIFGKIPKLPENWWTEDLENVWNIWDKDTYYLWGANSGNYLKQTIGEVIGGGGLAGPNGPTRGMAHPHYIGVNTMDFDLMSENDAVFANLKSLIESGKNVLVPIFNDDKSTPNMYKYSLGTGIGAGTNNWAGIQKYIFEKLLVLAKPNTENENCEIPNGVYWPDCQKPEPYPRYNITSTADIKTIIHNYLSK